MKSLIALSFLLSLSAFAAPKPYYVEEMNCNATIAGAYEKNQIHPSHYIQAVRVQSFRSMRNDGKAVDSNFITFGPNQWYTGGLKVEGNRVFKWEFDLYGRPLELKIVQTWGEDENSEYQRLIGDVKGAWGYTLDCIANVVKTPSRLVDLRKKAAESAQATDRLLKK